jgi:tetratricopeptide (TPR) repeat protein
MTSTVAIAHYGRVAAPLFADLAEITSLKYKKSVIPLRVHPEADLPYRLNSREYVDFTLDVNAALARLRESLAWASSPEGVAQDLQVRRSDAERELFRVNEQRRTLVEAEIAELDRRIDEQRRAIGNPFAVQERTSARIRAGLAREQQPLTTVRPPVVSRGKFVNPPPMSAPGYFQDRHVETGQIVDFLIAAGPRLMTVVGRGGVGKTAMVCRLLKALESGRLPDDRGELDVRGIVYLSPVGGHPVNFPNLFSDLCRLLHEDIAKALDEEYRDPQQTPTALVFPLLEEFSGNPGGPSVVLLDNFEDLLDPESGSITDPALDEALRALLTGPEHNVKVILTTRAAPRSLLLIQPGRQRRLNLDEGLPSPFGENILRAIDPDGSLGLLHAPDELLTLARERTRGFPRALEALAAILFADRDTTLRELLAETELLPGNVVEELVGEAFSRLDPLAQQVIQALSLFPIPVPVVAVDYVLQPYRASIDAAPVLARLANMAFARRDAGRYYIHQVDRQYALVRIPSGEPGDEYLDPPPFTAHAVVSRAGDYFEATRTPRETWKTLDDLAPQLAEFELRCQSGNYDVAAVVLLDIGANLLLWGHYRLTLELYRRIESRVSDQAILGYTHLGLAHCLRSLGQNRAAFENYRQARIMFRGTDNRDDEASVLEGLADCYSIFGQTTTAIEHYQQALAIYRETGNRDVEASSLSGLAGCYSTLGQTSNAIEHYQQALAIDLETGNRDGEASSLSGLAECYSTVGQSTNAIEDYQQALAIYRETGIAKSSGCWGGMKGLRDQCGKPRPLSLRPFATDYESERILV